MSEPSPYPPIGDYGLISDGRSMALVSRNGSIDWCCMPRVDSGSCFGRLLDWERGGHCSIEPADSDFSSFRSYLDDTMVLSTTLSGGGGEARILDCFSIPGRSGETAPIRLLRIVDGLRGLVRLHLRISPRFDYGEVRPWIRYHGRRLHSAVGGSDGRQAAVVQAAGRAGQQLTIHWEDQEADERQIPRAMRPRRGRRARLPVWPPALAPTTPGSCSTRTAGTCPARTPCAGTRTATRSTSASSARGPAARCWPSGWRGGAGAS